MDEANPMKRARERMKMTQEQLAKEFRVSTRWVMRKESGEVPITHIEMMALKYLEQGVELANEIL